MEINDVEKARGHIRLGRQKIHDESEQVAQEQPDIAIDPEVNPKLLRLFPPERLKKIMAKELRRFRIAQGKKWRNWFTSVSR